MMADDRRIVLANKLFKDAYGVDFSGVLTADDLKKLGDPLTGSLYKIDGTARVAIDVAPHDENRANLRDRPAESGEHRHNERETRVHNERSCALTH